MKAYVYNNPKAPAEVKDLLAEHFSDVSRVSSAFMQEAIRSLLWAINGGKLVELHRDWAVIELPVNRSQRIFHRRDVAAGKVTLPWNRA
jgi:hypothetical protein